jgi:large subunit ribosomal protein L21
MTYAIVATGGKQLRVEPGRFYDIERLPVEAEQQVTLDQVLFINNDGESLVGQPLVEGATVTGTIISHLRGRKVIIYKMKPKKKTRKKQGHRQELTRLMIDSIQLNGKAIAGEATVATPKAKAEAVATVDDTETDNASVEEETVLVVAPEEAVAETVVAEEVVEAAAPVTVEASVAETEADDDNDDEVEIVNTVETADDVEDEADDDGDDD